MYDACWASLKPKLTRRHARCDLRLISCWQQLLHFRTVVGRSASHSNRWKFENVVNSMQQMHCQLRLQCIWRNRHCLNYKLMLFNNFRHNVAANFLFVIYANLPNNVQAVTSYVQGFSFLLMLPRMSCHQDPQNHLTSNPLLLQCLSAAHNAVRQTCDKCWLQLCCVLIVIVCSLIVIQLCVLVSTSIAPIL